MYPQPTTPNPSQSIYINDKLSTPQTRVYSGDLTQLFKNTSNHTKPFLQEQKQITQDMETELKYAHLDNALVYMNSTEDWQRNIAWVIYSLTQDTVAGITGKKALEQHQQHNWDKCQEQSTRWSGNPNIDYLTIAITLGKPQNMNSKLSPHYYVLGYLEKPEISSQLHLYQEIALTFGDTQIGGITQQRPSVGEYDITKEEKINLQHQTILTQLKKTITKDTSPVKFGYEIRSDIAPRESLRLNISTVENYLWMYQNARTVLTELTKNHLYKSLKLKTAEKREHTTELTQLAQTIQDNPSLLRFFQNI